MYHLLRKVLAYFSTQAVRPSFQTSKDFWDTQPSQSRELVRACGQHVSDLLPKQNYHVTSTKVLVYIIHPTMPECLSQEQIAVYQKEGYIKLENHVPSHIMKELKQEIDQLSAQAQGLRESNDKIDLEVDSHLHTRPRIRRIKRPDQQSQLISKLIRTDHILAPVRDLIGPNVRLQATKLNMKSAGYGAPVQWHQDWAFYPYTNDDVLAVGLFVDDIHCDNAPLLVFPRTHSGSVYDHHDAAGYFTGAMDINASGLDVSDAVALTGPTGTLTIHHARLVHGSALNTSQQDRRMFFFELLAADAFPIAGSRGDFVDMMEFKDRLLCGTDTVEPRLVACPVRLPYPDPPIAVGSIYDYQEQITESSRKHFESVEAKE